MGWRSCDVTRRYVTPARLCGLMRSKSPCLCGMRLRRTGLGESLWAGNWGRGLRRTLALDSTEDLYVHLLWIQQWSCAYTRSGFNSDSPYTHWFQRRILPTLILVSTVNFPYTRSGYISEIVRTLLSIQQCSFAHIYAGFNRASIKKRQMSTILSVAN